MSVAFRSASSGNNGSGTGNSYAVTLPTGWQNGDFCFVLINVGAATPGFNALAGWANFNTNSNNGGAFHSSTLYYKQLVTGDTNPTFTSTTGGKAAWSAVAVSGANGESPSFDGSFVTVNYNATFASTSFTPPATLGDGVGGNDISLILIACRAAVAGAATAINETPSTGYTENATAESSTAVGTAAGTNQVEAAIIYKTGVNGRVANTPTAFTTNVSSYAIITQFVFRYYQLLAPAGPLPVNQAGSPTVVQNIKPAGIPSVAISGISHTSLTPRPVGIFPSGNLGNPVVLPGPVTIADSGIVTSSAAGSPKVIQQIKPAGIPSESAAGCIKMTLALNPAGIPSSEFLGCTQLNQTIYETGISCPSLVGSPHVTQMVKPAGIPCQAAVGVPALTLTFALRPAGIPSGETLGQAQLNQTIYETGISCVAAVGSPQITQMVKPAGIESTSRSGSSLVTFTMRPAGIPSTSVAGTANVSPGPVTIAPVGIPSVQSVGAPAVAPGPVAVAPHGIAPDSAAGAVTLNATYALKPIGIPSSEGLGRAQVNQTLHQAGIPNQSVLGEPVVSPGPVTLSPAGISPPQEVGAPKLTMHIVAASIVSTAEMGAPKAIVVVKATGIPSDAASGTSSITLHITVAGIPSTTAMGSPQASPGPVTLAPRGIESGSALGIAHAAIGISVRGIESDSVAGSPYVVLMIRPAGIPSSSVFGNTSRTSIVGVHPAGIPSQAQVGSASTGIVFVLWPPRAGGIRIGAAATSGSITVRIPVADVAISTGSSGTPDIVPVGSGSSPTSGGAHGTVSIDT